jgi:hypothetical protein
VGQASVPNHPNCGTFSYSPNEEKGGELHQIVQELIHEAERRVGPIHIVVFPECSLTETQFDFLSVDLVKRKIMLIAGVAQGSYDRQKARNEAVVATADIAKPTERSLYSQRKHHRWCLDREQIVRYGLSGQLDPRQFWWEDIAVDERLLRFYPLREWLCMSVLICEDLARLDPVGQYIRAVGPDLVIALLCDGPQLATRWPAYHATVLADDPGSSVLTITSLGMSNLSRPTSRRFDGSERIIGMWRDPHVGFVEIRLPADNNAAVLSLRRHDVHTRTIDGREKAGNSGSPAYGGLTFI